MAPRTSGARRLAGGGAGARIPRGCERIPAPNPATGGAPNPAPLAGHPAGQGSRAGLGAGLEGVRRVSGKPARLDLGPSPDRGL